MDQNLIDYIKQCREQNISDEEIKKALIDAGWKEEDINEGLKPINLINPIDNIEPSKKAPKKILKFAIIIIGILIIAGAAAAGYSYLRKTSIAGTLETMIEKMQDINSFHYQSEIEITGNLQGTTPILMDNKSNTGMFLASIIQPIIASETNNENSPTSTNKVLMKIDGDVDNINSENFKISANLSIKTDIPLGPEIELETKFINKIFYIKFSNLTVPGIADFGEFFEDQWIMIDLNQLIELIESSQLEAETPEIKISDEQKQEIEKLIEESSVITIKKISGSEKINNNKTNHYKVSINKDNLKNLIIEINKITGNPLTEIKSLDEIIQELDDIEKADIDIWIDKSDKTPYKITINNTDENNINIRLSFTISDINNPMDITEPQNTKTLEEVMSSLFSGNMAVPKMQEDSTANMRARDAQRISDVRRVALALEMYRGDKNSYPIANGCTASNWNNLSTILKDYVYSVETDPLNSGEYVYTYASNGKDYIVRAYLENSFEQGYNMDKDGNILGCNCNGRAYCVSP